ncbi:unnamed protein product [Ascophyllum nodosum]
MRSFGKICVRVVRSSSGVIRGQHRTLTSSASLASGGARSPQPNQPDDAGQDQDTHFGFQQVPSNLKKGMVKTVFSSVAHNYDVMNDLMSAGKHRYRSQKPIIRMHRLWKDDFVNMLGISSGWDVRSPPPKVLDVAGGTGDIAFRVADQLRPYMHSSGEEYSHDEDGADVPLLTVSDINPDMLEVGKQRAEDRFSSETLDSMQFVQADAEALPFPDDTFHLYTIAFGLRNVTDMDKALREAHRVLRPGGRFMCLEFSRVPIAPLRQAYDWYSFNVIPTIGQAVARDRDAYQYLVESIRMFPRQEELEDRMSTAGFKMVTHTNFTSGVVAVHSGFNMPHNRSQEAR